MANSWMTTRNKEVTAFGVKIPNEIDYSKLKNDETFTPPRPLNS